MDNQHKLIKGYRDLTAEEIALMNRVKEHGEALRSLLIEVFDNRDIDQTWAARAEEHLQMGIMCLVRSIAKPESF